MQAADTAACTPLPMSRCASLRGGFRPFLDSLRWRDAIAGTRDACATNPQLYFKMGGEGFEPPTLSV